MDEIDAETRELQRDPVAGIARVMRRMGDDPGFHAKWYLKKPWVLWGWKIRLGASDLHYHVVRNSPLDRNGTLRAVVATYRALNPLLTTMTLACGLWLIVLGVRRSNMLPAAATGALAIYVTLVHEVLQAEPRYATAYRGLEAVLVVTALAWGWRWLQTYRKMAPSSSGAGAKAN
jgi:hypothetical protein